MRQLRRSRPLGSLMLLASLAAPGLAGEVQVETAEPPRALPQLESSDGEAIDMEASGVEALGRDVFLVAGDKDQPIVVLDASGASPRVAKQLKLQGAPKKPKWEAMARDHGGSVYVIGSHNAATETNKAVEKLAARSTIVRFEIEGDPARPQDLKAKRELTLSITRALAGTGLYDAQNPQASRAKIEGLAVRARGEAGRPRPELVVGLREPFDCPGSGGACVRALSADLGGVPGGAEGPFELSLAPLFTFQAGARQGVPSKLASLAYVPEWQGFLVLTSTEDDAHEFHGNTLWFLPDAEARGTALGAAQKVWVFGLLPEVPSGPSGGNPASPEAKAEGLTVFPRENGADPDRLRIAIVYDDDANDTEKPSLLQRVTLVRWPD
jgi:hypothetical protein